MEGLFQPMHLLVLLVLLLGIVFSVIALVKWRKLPTVLKVLLGISWIVFGGVLLIAITVVLTLATRHTVSAASIQPPPPSIQPPRFDWVAVTDETRVLNPGEILAGYEIPQGVPSIRTRVQISAKSPISVGYVSQQYREAMTTNPLETTKLSIFYCLREHTLQATVTCNLDTSNDGYFLYVRDERTSGEALGAGFAAAFGVKGPAEQMAMRNDVHVVYSALGCVENCPAKQQH